MTRLFFGLCFKKVSASFGEAETFFVGRRSQKNRDDLSLTASHFLRQKEVHIVFIEKKYVKIGGTLMAF